MKTATQHKTIVLGGKLFSFESPKIMGILNLTPDSFYDGGKWKSEAEILKGVEKMLGDGADIIDIGGQSTRPGSESVSETEELKRIIEPLKAIKKSFPEALVSIDTFRANVARAAIEEGACLINDVAAASFEPEILAIAAKYKVPYIAMHKQGNPKTMQENPQYDNVVEEVLNYLVFKQKEVLDAGVLDVIIDPGFGFGKTLEHNFMLLKSLKRFQILQMPVLVGLSRKSMVCKALQTEPKYALNGSTALHMVALQNGADILRVHDVKEAKECITLFQHLQSA